MKMRKFNQYFWDIELHHGENLDTSIDFKISFNILCHVNMYISFDPYQ